MVIDLAKLDACIYSSFRGVKTDTQTDRIALYINILDLALEICYNLLWGTTWTDSASKNPNIPFYRYNFELFLMSQYT